MELDIEVLWHSDDTKALADLGMDFDIEDLITKVITFYSIDVISPYKWDDEHMFCKINSGCETWIAACEYEELKEKIAKARHEAVVKSHVELFKAAEFLIKEHNK